MIQKWLDDLFTTHISPLQLNRIALIVDIVRPHGKTKISDESKITILPENLTAIHQPMHMEIIEQWEMCCRKNFYK